MKTEQSAALYYFENFFDIARKENPEHYRRWKTQNDGQIVFEILRWGKKFSIAFDSELGHVSWTDFENIEGSW